MPSLACSWGQANSKTAFLEIPQLTQLSLQWGPVALATVAKVKAPLHGSDCGWVVFEAPTGLIAAGAGRA